VRKKLQPHPVRAASPPEGHRDDAACRPLRGSPRAKRPPHPLFADSSRYHEGPWRRGGGGSRGIHLLPQPAKASSDPRALRPRWDSGGVGCWPSLRFKGRRHHEAVARQARGSFQNRTSGKHHLRISRALSGPTRLQPVDTRAGGRYDSRRTGAKGIRRGFPAAPGDCPYRCFLSDLAGFRSLRRAGPCRTPSIRITS